MKEKKSEREKNKQKTMEQKEEGVKNRENYIADIKFKNVNWSTGSKIAELSNSFMAEDIAISSTEMLELYGRQFYVWNVI